MKGIIAGGIAGVGVLTAGGMAANAVVQGGVSYLAREAGQEHGIEWLDRGGNAFLKATAWSVAGMAGGFGGGAVLGAAAGAAIGRGGGALVGAAVGAFAGAASGALGGEIYGFVKGLTNPDDQGIF